MAELVNYPGSRFVACDICKHRTGGNTCKAFPAEIPFEFISINIPHTENEFDQLNDFVFELGELKEDAEEDLKDFYEAYKNLETNKFEKPEKQEQNILGPIGTRKCLEVIKYIIKGLKDFEYIPDVYHIVKMLYFADRAHLKINNNPITLSKYLKMKFGPVPGLCYSILQFVREDNFTFPFDESIKKELRVLDKDRFECLIDYAKDYLSETNIKCLDAAIAKYGKLGFDDLMKESHDEIYHSVKYYNEEITMFHMLDVLNSNKEFAEHCLQIFDNKVASVSESVQNNEVPF